MSDLLMATRPTGCETLHARAAHLAREVAAVVERIGSTDLRRLGNGCVPSRLGGHGRHRVRLRPAATRPSCADGSGWARWSATCWCWPDLPEVHEGVAASFRAMNPNDEPWPTAGIAAVVLEERADRSEVLDMLCSGPLVRHGLVQLSGKGPRFEQSMQPAEALWAVLAGHDAWPEELHRVDVGEVPSGLSRWVETVPAQQAVRALGSNEARTLLVQSHDSRHRARSLRHARSDREDRFRRCTRPTRRPPCAESPRRPTRPHEPLFRSSSSTGPTKAVRRGCRQIISPVPLVVCMTPGAARFSAQRPLMTVPIGPITPDDRRDAWRSVLPDRADDSDNLAVQHPLDPALTAQVAP